MPIPIGIIGCGGHAQHHAKNFAANFVTHTVWDLNPAAMETIHTVHTAISLEQMLASHYIKAVMICSPDEFHIEQIEMALAAGKHVFCEKPLLMPGQKLERLMDAFSFAEQNKLVLTSCHPRRFDLPMKYLLKQLKYVNAGTGFADTLGKPMGFEFDFSYHEPVNTWKHTRSLLLDHVNHEVDLMNAIFGIQGFDAWKLADGFDHYEVAGKRDDGLLFRFRGTRRLKGRKYPETMRIRFERGEIMIDADKETGKITLIDHELGQCAEGSGHPEQIKIDYDGRLESVMQNFSDAILGKAENYLSRAEMLMNTEAGIVLQNEGVQRINVR